MLDTIVDYAMALSFSVVLAAGAMDDLEERFEDSDDRGAPKRSKIECEPPTMSPASSSPGPEKQLGYIIICSSGGRAEVVVADMAKRLGEDYIVFHVVLMAGVMSGAGDEWVGSEGHHAAPMTLLSPCLAITRTS